MDRVIRLPCLDVYTLSHPKHDSNVTELAQGYALQDAQALNE